MNKHLRSYIVGAFGVCILMSTLFSACGFNKAGNDSTQDVPNELKHWAVVFGGCLQKMDVKYMRNIYPDAALAQGLKLDYNPDQAEVTKGVEENTFKVTYGPNAYLKVQYDGKRSVKVLESSGIFVFDAAELKMAHDTGMYEKGITDAGLARRLADKGFRTWLYQKSNAEIAKKLKLTAYKTDPDEDEYISGDHQGGIYTITAKLVNGLGRSIDGNDYKVIVTMESVGPQFDDIPGSNIGRWYEEFRGKNIPAGETGWWTDDDPEGWNYFRDSLKGAKLVWKISDKEKYAKYYTPTGNEYREWSGGSSTGPYEEVINLDDIF